MEGAIIVGIVFSGIVLCLAIIGATILLGIKIAKGGISRKSQQSRTEDAKMVQEMYQSVARMEARVEALETILLEKERKDLRP
jgi:phage shock protein B